jgi:hypothetical protein
MSGEPTTVVEFPNSENNFKAQVKNIRMIGSSGISLNKKTNKYQIFFHRNNVKIYMGSFDDFNEASSWRSKIEKNLLS